MRKRVISQPDNNNDPSAREGFLNLERLAQIEVTSKDPAHPVELALLLSTTTGWRAAQPGEQLIRILLDAPQTLRRISLLFREHQETRTQEFVLRWASTLGSPLQDIARQQYTFSPNGATQKLEDYQVDLASALVLELSIIPDISRGHAHASLNRMRLA